MSSCDVCSTKVYLRNGSRNKFHTNYCSRFCYELNKQTLNPTTTKLKINCSMCGTQFSITSKHCNAKHSNLCSIECRNKKDTQFGRKSQKKYSILMMLKLNGRLSATDISTRLTQAFPSFRLNPASVSAALRVFVLRGGVRKYTDTHGSEYELVYDMPLQELCKTLIH